MINTYNERLEVYILRNSLFYDAYSQIMNIKLYQLKNKLRIKYVGEEGVDAGGLLRYI